MENTYRQVPGEKIRGIYRRGSGKKKNVSQIV
jgi:hypothetical protein